MHIKPLSARQNKEIKNEVGQSVQLYTVYGYIYAVSFIPNNNNTGNDKMTFPLPSGMTIILLYFPFRHFMASVVQSYIIVIDLYVD